LIPPAESVVCVDACLAVKLILPEQDSESAVALWQEWQQSQIRVIAPSLITWEVANSIRRTVLGERLPVHAAGDAYSAFLGLGITTTTYSRLPVLAWRQFVLASDLRISPYDATYLATAQAAECELWTADDRLVCTVGDELPWVHSLSEIAGQVADG